MLSTANAAFCIALALILTVVWWPLLRILLDGAM